MQKKDRIPGYFLCSVDVKVLCPSFLVSADQAGAISRSRSWAVFGLVVCLLPRSRFLLSILIFFPSKIFQSQDLFHKPQYYVAGSLHLHFRVRPLPYTQHGWTGSIRAMVGNGSDHPGPSLTKPVTMRVSEGIRVSTLTRFVLVGFFFF
jgi:hypothetical protein